MYWALKGAKMKPTLLRHPGTTFILRHARFQAVKGEEHRMTANDCRELRSSAFQKKAKALGQSQKTYAASAQCHSLTGALGMLGKTQRWPCLILSAPRLRKENKGNAIMLVRDSFFIRARNKACCSCCWMLLVLWCWWLWWLPWLLSLS